MAQSRSRFFPNAPPGTILKLKTVVDTPGSAAADADLKVDGVKTPILVNGVLKDTLTTAELLSGPLEIGPIEPEHNLTVRFDLVFHKAGTVTITPTAAPPGEPEIERTPISLSGAANATDFATVTAMVRGAKS